MLSQCDVKGVLSSIHCLRRAEFDPFFRASPAGAATCESIRKRKSRPGQNADGKLLCIGCCLNLFRILPRIGFFVTPRERSLEEHTPGEKLWLLAGELLRDEGIEDVTAQHLATVIGQALTCVGVYSAIDPLDPRTMDHVISRAVNAALDAHAHFIDQIRAP